MRAISGSKYSIRHANLQGLCNDTLGRLWYGRNIMWNNAVTNTCAFWKTQHRCSHVTCIKGFKKSKYINRKIPQWKATLALPDCHTPVSIPGGLSTSIEICMQVYAMAGCLSRDLLNTKTKLQNPFHPWLDHGAKACWHPSWGSFASLNWSIPSGKEGSALSCSMISHDDNQRRSWCKLLCYSPQYLSSGLDTIKCLRRFIFRKSRRWIAPRHRH